VGAFHDEFADELGQGGKDVEDQLTPGVVVSRASCSDRNPTSNKLSYDTAAAARLWRTSEQLVGHITAS